jgi:gentisate 1,2-dioxygenase
MAGEVLPEMRFHDEDPDVDALYGDLSAAALQPLWQQVGLLPHAPRTIAPYVWRWKTVKALAERAGDLVGIERGGDRRVLALSHPDLGGKPFATPTLWAGIQFLNGHESAPPHRHSPAALRFVMEGSGVWTLVNGDAVLMEPGDLVLTPSYNWHAHDNPGDQPMVWFDGLDLPMIQSLDAVFFEEGPGKLEPYAARTQSNSEIPYAAAGLIPSSVVGSPEIRTYGLHSPLLAYRWSTTAAVLERSLAATPQDYTLMRYTDPTTGSDVMPTLRAEILRLRSAGRVPPHRKVGSSVMLVHHGSGTSLIADVEIRWAPGDIFVIPSWATVSHHADEESDLFVLSDAPVIEKVGLRREELA